jgi:hypothetical protein
MVKQTGIDVTPYVGQGSDAIDKLFGYGVKKMPRIVKHMKI